MFTDQPFLPIDPPTIFLNRIWDNGDEEELSVGMLPPYRNNYKQDARWKLPALKFSGHMCKPEYLQTGEPWPIPAGTPSTVYLDGWIPECCVMACAAEGCTQEPVNDQPASQRMQYAIDAKDATDADPVFRQTVAVAEATGGGSWPASVQEWFGTGLGGPAQFTTTDITRYDGVPFAHVEQFVIGPGESQTLTQDATGWLLDVVQGGVSASLGVRVLAGVGQLYGTNLTIAPSVLPPDVVVAPPFTVPAIYYRTSPTGWAPVTIGTGLSFVGNTLSATALGGTVTSVDIATSSFGVAVGGGPIVGAGTLTVNIAPDLNNLVGFTALHAILSGNGAGGWAPVTIGSGLSFVGSTLNTVNNGTVTSVNISTTSGGLAVGGGPIVGAGTLTVDLDADLNALAALSGTNTIYYRSGISTWSPVTFNSSMSFAAGVLEPAVAIKDLVTLATGTGLLSFSADGHSHATNVGNFLQLVAGTPNVLNVIPPTASQGEALFATVPLVGAANVYTATGWTFVLPTAGTWLISGSVRGQIQPAGPGNMFLKFQLRDNTLGAFIANSECLIVLSSQPGILTSTTAGFTRVYTTTGPVTLEVYAARTVGPWTVSDLVSDAGGRSVFDVTRLF